MESARHYAERAQVHGERLRGWAERTRGFGAVLESFETEQRSGVPLLAGGLAYRMFFWLVAFGLLLAALLSFWVRSDQHDAESAARSFGLAGVATRSASSAIREGSHARWYFLFAGIALVIYFGIGAVRALRISAFLAWRVEPTRLRHSVKASLVFSGLLVAGFVIGLASAWVRHHGPGIGVTATIGGVFGFMALLVFGFSHLPHADVPDWKVHLPGAALAAVGVIVMQAVVAYYLAAKLERSPKLYGALGSSTVVLLWLFLMARLFVSALFLNATVERRRVRGRAT